MTSEEIVKAARDAGFSSGEIFQRLAAFKRLIESAAAAEREECAKVCDYQITRWTDDRARYASSECAAGIRSRGNP